MKKKRVATSGADLVREGLLDASTRLRALAVTMGETHPHKRLRRTWTALYNLAEGLFDASGSPDGVEVFVAVQKKLPDMPEDESASEAFPF